MNSRESSGAIDPFEVRKLYKYLRVTDVSDAMDGIGYFNLGLMSPQIRPLWLGIRFWGAALTIRCVPANRPMWKLTTPERVVRTHQEWFEQVPVVPYRHLLEIGHVIVTDVGGGPEAGYWGSANALGMINRGVVGIVSNGSCRDTAECKLEKLPICANGRGRPNTPGRVESVEVQTKIGCGGVQVGPGDIVGCDDDGVIVVPLEIAKEVAILARAVLLDDMKSRRKLYEAAGISPDESVDYDTVMAYYSQFE